MVDTQAFYVRHDQGFIDLIHIRRHGSANLHFPHSGGTYFDIYFPPKYTSPERSLPVKSTRAHYRESISTSRFLTFFLLHSLVMNDTQLG